MLSIFRDIREAGLAPEITTDTHPEKVRKLRLAKMATALAIQVTFITGLIALDTVDAKSSQTTLETPLLAAKEVTPSYSLELKNGIHGVSGERIEWFMKILTDEYGIPPRNAAFLTADLIWESKLNPYQPGDYDKKTGEYTAYGLAQWRGGRRDSMPAITGDYEQDVRNQTEYLLRKDIVTDFKTKDSYQLLWNPNAVDNDLGQLMLDFERPDMEEEVKLGYPRIQFAQTIISSIQAG